MAKEVRPCLFSCSDKEILINGHTLVYRHDISLVVNCSSKRTPYTNDATTVLSIPWSEDEDQLLYPQIELAAKMIWMHIDQQRNVMVHCSQSGIRSAALLVYFLMRYDHLEFKDAAVGYPPFPPAFRTQLVQLDKWIQGGQKGRPAVEEYCVPLLGEDEEYLLEGLLLD
jgi:hypothetical protein